MGRFMTMNMLLNYPTYLLLKLMQINIFLMNKFNRLKIFQSGLIIQKMMKLLIYHFILMLFIKDFKMQVPLSFIIVIMRKLLIQVENMMQMELNMNIKVIGHGFIYSMMNAKMEMKLFLLGLLNKLIQIMLNLMILLILMIQLILMILMILMILRILIMWMILMLLFGLIKFQHYLVFLYLYLFFK